MYSNGEAERIIRVFVEKVSMAHRPLLTPAETFKVLDPEGETGHRDEGVLHCC